MQAMLSTPQWLSLPQPVRLRLVELFGVRRSSGSQVQDNVVISDGHTMDDLKAINVGTMQMFLNSKETDYYTLFNQVLEVIEAELVPPVVATEPELPTVDLKITIDKGGNIDTKVITNDKNQTNAKTKEGAEGKAGAKKQGRNRKGDTATTGDGATA